MIHYQNQHQFLILKAFHYLIQVGSQVQNQVVFLPHFQIQTVSHSQIQCPIPVHLVSQRLPQLQHLILRKIRSQSQILNQHLTQAVIRPLFQSRIVNQAQHQAQNHSPKVKKYHSQNRCQSQ